MDSKFTQSAKRCRYWTSDVPQKINVKIKGWVYRTVVRPALSGRDMVIEEGTGKEIGGRRNASVTMECECYDGCEVTELERIRNERIRGATRVGDILKKRQEIG